MSDLKPCPNEWCCSEIPPVMNEREAGNGTKLFYLKCRKCELETPGLLSQEEAFSLWNTRADTAELAALRAERDALVAEKARDFKCVIQTESAVTDQLRAELEMNTKNRLGLQEDVKALRYRAERAESDAAESKRRCGDLEGHLEFALDFIDGVKGWIDSVIEPYEEALKKGRAALNREASK